VAEIHFDEDDDLIDIRMDNVFKAVFTKETPESRGALAKLLSAIIGLELSVDSIAANEPPIDNIRDRQIRFDINCRTGNGELVNVEMSLNPDTFEPVRLEYYAGRLYTGQDIRGKDEEGMERSFDDLKPAYQVAFLARGRFFADPVFLHAFEYYDPKRGVSLNGRSRIITLELGKLGAVMKKPVREMSEQEHWAVFFRYLTDKRKRRKINELMECEEGIEMASKVLLTISKDEAERNRLMSELKYELDHQSKVANARREGYKKAETKYQEQVRQKDEQVRRIQEQNRRMADQIDELQRQLGQKQ
jgi:predicted transposase/invertase (TIGR01784 family)